jgi:PIN domain nuclease of toxin-antitoxin system
VIVLDTHALIWVLEDAPRLGRRAAAAANRALSADDLWTSAVTFWEVSLLLRFDRLRMTLTAEQFRAKVQRLGIQEAPLTGDIAVAAAHLSVSIKDPADAFIAATSVVHHAKLLTADTRLLGAKGVDTIDARR